MSDLGRKIQEAERQIIVVVECVGRIAVSVALLLLLLIALWQVILKS